MTNTSVSFSGQYMLVMQLLMATAIILNILVIHVHFQSMHAWKVPFALRDFFFYRIGPWLKMSNNIAKCKTNQARVRNINDCIIFISTLNKTAHKGDTKVTQGDIV